MIVEEMARFFRSRACRTVVAAPVNGPLSESLARQGTVVIVDPDLLKPGRRVIDLASSVDLVICNTVATARVAAACADRARVIWYIHEISLLRERLGADPSVAAALEGAYQVWVGSALPAAIVRPLRPDVAVVSYGLDPVQPPFRKQEDDGRLRIGIFGSVEARKGQDLALKAIETLAPNERAQISVALYGRILELDFAKGVLALASKMPEVVYGGELDRQRYLDELRNMDAVLVPSRDDTLPLVTLDGLSSARVLISSKAVGTAAYLENGVNAFIAETPTVAGFSALLKTAIARRTEWERIGAAGRRVFDEFFSRKEFEDKLETALTDATAQSLDPIPA